MVSPARSTPTQSNFLPVPSKQAEHLEAYAADLLAYIGGHFRDAHPEAFKGDVGKLVDMRREWVEPKVEAHPEIARGLMKCVAVGSSNRSDTTRNLPLWRQSSRPMWVVVFPADARLACRLRTVCRSPRRSASRQTHPSPSLRSPTSARACCITLLRLMRPSPPRNAVRTLRVSRGHWRS